MKKIWLWISIIVLILALGGELSYLYWPQIKVFSQKYLPKSAQTVQPIIQIAASPSASPTVKSVVVSDAGVTWIEPKKLDDLKLTVAQTTNDAINNTNIYYKIADLTGGGELDLDVYQPDCPCQPELLRFKKDSAGKYTYLVKNSAEQDYSTFSQVIKPEVVADYQTIYQSITAPDFLTVNGATLKAGGNTGLFSDISKDAQEITTTDYGKIYRTGINYSLKLADSTYAIYVNKFSFQTDNEISLVTWLDGTANTARYTAEGYVACGRTASNNIVSDTTDISSRLTQIGKTNAGDPVYTVVATDALMKAAYDNYKVGRDKDILTIDQFAAKKPIFIWKNALGDYIVFTGRDFAGLAECGKPVIYLYPTEETQVNVKLGATITKSEPVYNNGWQVMAKPNGELTFGDKIYQSLYWEGTGQDYPIVNQGFVVAKADLERTLKEQVAKLGLNDKESADFMAFWLPKMPKTAYTRLTWFGTKDINRLAPLTITPKPDTVIRIFLDFQGLNQKIDLKPQVLSAIPRQGFTVIEWGGLLK